MPLTSDDRNRSGDAEQVQRKQRGRRPLPIEHYRRVAEVYDAALRDGASPYNAVAAEFGKAESTVKRWVSRCREEGLIRPTSASSDSSVRSLQAKIASHSRWAKTADRTSATTPGRTAFMSRFEAQVDPDRSLAPDVRAKLAENARKAYFLRLAQRSAQARAERKAAKEATDG